MGTLWTGQTPSNPNENNGAPIATGDTVRFDEDDVVVGVQFRATAVVGGTYTATVWEVTAGDDAPDGDILRTSDPVDASAIVAGSDNTIPVTALPVTGLTKLYRFGVHNSQGRYVASPGFFTTNPLSNDGITAYANGDDPVGLGTMRQGNFVESASAATYLSQPGNGTAYHVGPVTAAQATAELAGVAAAATFTGTAEAHSDAQLAGVATAATFTAAAGAASTVALAGVAAAATLSVHATSGGTVVPVPDTGTISRPDTGTIQVPRIAYP